jgi:hypothetical protein
VQKKVLVDYLLSKVLSMTKYLSTTEVIMCSIVPNAVHQAAAAAARELKATLETRLNTQPMLGKLAPKLKELKAQQAQAIEQLREQSLAKIADICAQRAQGGNEPAQKAIETELNQNRQVIWNLKQRHKAEQQQMKLDVYLAHHDGNTTLLDMVRLRTANNTIALKAFLDAYAIISTGDVLKKCVDALTLADIAMSVNQLLNNEQPRLCAQSKAGQFLNGRQDIQEFLAPHATPNAFLSQVAAALNNHAAAAEAAAGGGAEANEYRNAATSMLTLPIFIFNDGIALKAASDSIELNTDPIMYIAKNGELALKYKTNAQRDAAFTQYFEPAQAIIQKKYGRFQLKYDENPLCIYFPAREVPAHELLRGDAYEVDLVNPVLMTQFKCATGLRHPQRRDGDGDKGNRIALFNITPSAEAAAAEAAAAEAAAGGVAAEAAGGGAAEAPGGVYDASAKKDIYLDERNRNKLYITAALLKGDRYLKLCPNGDHDPAARTLDPVAAHAIQEHRMNARLHSSAQAGRDRGALAEHRGLSPAQLGLPAGGGAGLGDGVNYVEEAEDEIKVAPTWER